MNGAPTSGPGAEALEKLEVGADLTLGIEAISCPGAGGGGHGGAAVGTPEQLGERSGETSVVAGGDEAAGGAVAEGLGDAVGIEGDDGETSALRLDEKVGQGLVTRL